jgi:hypothetical protein
MKCFLAPDLYQELFYYERNLPPPTEKVQLTLTISTTASNIQIFAYNDHDRVRIVCRSVLYGHSWVSLIYYLGDARYGHRLLPQQLGERLSFGSISTKLTLQY